MKYELRAWQKKALGDWIDNGHRGIVEVVTGGGKTVFAEACIEQALRQWPRLRTVVVVPTVSLADQWVVSLTEEAGFSPDDVGIFSRKKADPKKFTVVVINTARLSMEQLVDRDNPTLLIVDECHRSGSEANLKALIGDFAATLGLSATPDRPYDGALHEEIIPRLGPVIYKYTLAEARRDGVVSPFELVNVRVPLTTPENQKYKKASKQIGHRVRQLKKLGLTSYTDDNRLTTLLRRRAGIANAAAMRVPTCISLVERHRSVRTIIFHEAVAAIETIRSLAEQRGHSTTAYHTKIGGSFRRENLRLFRRGVFDVLCSCRALDEGMNVPEVQVAVIAAATATRRQRIQRLGRVLRPADNKERAIVYTLYATDREERRLAEEAELLEEIASVRWMKADAGYGSDTD